MERLWYTGHPTPAGDLIFDIGPRLTTPNRNVMDAFAGVAVPGRQWNFPGPRGGLRPDPLTTTVGPLSIQVHRRPAAAIGSRLGPNDFGHPLSRSSSIGAPEPA